MNQLRLPYKFIGILLIVAAVFLASYYELRPVAQAGAGQTVQFEVVKGDGFTAVARKLADQHLIRNRWFFELYALLDGAARRIKPGVYTVNTASSSRAILDQITTGSNVVRVTIPEGTTSYEIDRILAQNNVISAGQLISYLKSTSTVYEGMLFPDTYDFYLRSDPAAVVARMYGNFEQKAVPLLEKDPQKFKQNLVLASLVEREVTSDADRRFVAGILEKRLSIGMPLQIDYSICYSKEVVSGQAVDCYPLTSLDYSLNTDYNTYLHRGLPLGPITNPGLSAIQAVLQPTASKYLYYLSDPKTKQTIFSATLNEQTQNKAKYLK